MRLKNSLREATDAFQIRFLTEALRRCDYNMTRTASYLQMDRPNLYRKLRDLGVQRRKVRL